MRRGRRRRSKTKLIILGRPITKKNSQRIALTKTGKRFIIQSPQYLRYEKDCLKQIKHIKTITEDINLQVLYYMPTKARPDLNNLLAATCDILQKAKVINNDKNIVSFDGSHIAGVDKNNPRTEITIEGR